jgi:hypothetical protein
MVELTARAAVGCSRARLSLLVQGTATSMVSISADLLILSGDRQTAGTQQSCLLVLATLSDLSDA